MHSRRAWCSDQPPLGSPNPAHRRAAAGAGTQRDASHRWQTKVRRLFNSRRSQHAARAIGVGEKAFEDGEENEKFRRTDLTDPFLARAYGECCGSLSSRAYFQSAPLLPGPPHVLQALPQGSRADARPPPGATSQGYSASKRPVHHRDNQGAPAAKLSSAVPKGSSAKYRFLTAATSTIRTSRRTAHPRAP